MTQLPRAVRRRPRLTWWWWRLKTSWLPVVLTLLTVGLIATFLTFLARGDDGPSFDLKEAITLLLAVLSLGATLHTMVDLYRREGRDLPPSTAGRDFAKRLQEVA